MHFKLFTLRNALKECNFNQMHRVSSNRFFGKSINRNQSIRSNYINRTKQTSNMIHRTLSTTNLLTKGSMTKMSNVVNPTGPMLAIRREDASIWERRSPLAPFHVKIKLKMIKNFFKIIF